MGGAVPEGFTVRVVEFRSAWRLPSMRPPWNPLRLALSLTLLLLSVPLSTAMARTPGQCSSASLQGLYLYKLLGRDALAEGATTAGPYAEAGMSRYDGRGGVETRYSSSAQQDVEIRGTYQISSDCAGTLRYVDGDRLLREYRIYVDPQGARLSFVDITDPLEGYILGGEQLRVARQTTPLKGCSERTLSGTYTYNSEGALPVDDRLQLFREAGLEAYDGVGGIRNRFTDTLGNDTTVAGEYQIAPDCSGHASYDSGGVYRLYVAPNGRQFVFIDTAPGSQRPGLSTRVSRQRLIEAPDAGQ